MSEPVAIRIKFNMTTGIRAGGVNPSDRNLYCGQGWQNLETGEEMRLVKDSRVDVFENNPKVKVIRGLDNIRAELADMCPPREVYTITNERIMDHHLRTASIDWSELDQQADAQGELKFLYDKGIRGISKVSLSPQDPEELMDLLT